MHRSTLQNRISRFLGITLPLALLLSFSLSFPAQGTANQTSKDWHSKEAPDAVLYNVKIVHGQRRTITGANRSYVLYIPQSNRNLSKAPYPVVLMIHGFLMSSNEQRHTSYYLAQRGIAVICPNMDKIMLGSERRTRNVEEVVDQLNWLVKESKKKGSPYYGLFDSSRLAIAGNSSGGALCFEGVLQAQKIKMPFISMCSLEGVPWDRTLSRVKEVEPLNILTLRAEPCICNYHWNVLKYIKALNFPTDDVKINGAHHCDAENPTTIGCMSVCGTTHNKYRRLFELITYYYLRDTLHAPKFEPQSFSAIISEMQKDGLVLSHLNNIQSAKLSDSFTSEPEQKRN